MKKKICYTFVIENLEVPKEKSLVHLKNHNLKPNEDIDKNKKKIGGEEYTFHKKNSTKNCIEKKCLIFEPENGENLGTKIACKND